MKLLFLAAALLAAGPTLLFAEPTSAAQQAIRAKLPAFSAEEHARAVAEETARMAARAEAKAAAAADPDLVVLPAMTVIEKTIRRMNEDSLYRKGAHDKELVKRELSGFDRYFLNRYTLALPLLPGISIGAAGSQSLEARARSAYLERQKRLHRERINRHARLLETEDPEEARALRKMIRDEPTTGQPITYDWRPTNMR